MAVELEVERLGSDHTDIAIHLTEYSEFLPEEDQDSRAEAVADRAVAILGESEAIESSK